MEKKKGLGYLFKMELGGSARQLLMMGIFVIICIGFSGLTAGMFTSARNLSNLCLQASATGILAIGVVWILVAGQIDLSLGSVVGFMGALASYLMVKRGWASIPAIIAVLLAGMLIGAWQGYWVAYRKLPSFIVTLAGMQIFRGFCLVSTGGQTLSPMKDLYKAFGQAYIPGIVAKEKGFVDTAIIFAAIVCVILVISEIRRIKSRKKYNLEVAPVQFTVVKMIIVCIAVMFVGWLLSRHLGVPIAFVVLLGFAVVFNYVSQNTSFGLHIFALGGNKEAAKLSGINIDKITFLIFVITGMMCSVSSIVYTARLNAATAAAGTGMEMDAIAAAIIGGTSTMGGEGNVFGAIIGAFIMSSIDNGMSIMNLPPQVQYIVKGMVLLLAVWLDVASRNRQQS